MPSLAVVNLEWYLPGAVPIPLQPVSAVVEERQGPTYSSTYESPYSTVPVPLDEASGRAGTFSEDSPSKALYFD